MPWWKKAPVFYVHPQKKKAQDMGSNIVYNLRESNSIKKLIAHDGYILTMWGNEKTNK